MILNTKMRNSQAEERLQNRCNAETLRTVITNGTNCSDFEARLISSKAQEVFNIGSYNKSSSLQPGQMIWQAISAEEPPGKPLDKCEFKRITLTVHSLGEDREIKNECGMSAKRGQQIMRISEEAYNQGTLLTIEDLAVILDCNERTIRRDIKLFEKEYGILVPTRGRKCDIGPGVTHREKVLEMFIQGKDAVSISRDINHSLKAVERYIDTFCRIIFCQQQVKNSMQTALIVGVSIPLVNKCFEIQDRFMCTAQYRARIDDIREKGSAFWEMQDSKKKDGLLKGMKK